MLHSTWSAHRSTLPGCPAQDSFRAGEYSLLVTMGSLDQHLPRELSKKGMMAKKGAAARTRWRWGDFGVWGYVGRGVADGEMVRRCCRACSQAVREGSRCCWLDGLGEGKRDGSENSIVKEVREGCARVRGGVKRLLGESANTEFQDWGIRLGIAKVYKGIKAPDNFMEFRILCIYWSYGHLGAIKGYSTVRGHFEWLEVTTSLKSPVPVNVSSPLSSVEAQINSNTRASVSSVAKTNPSIY
ncbi:hypothetical protein VNO77_43985 [Canavalia gladiata]|uniref:Uncharacterized protein n=1 Tax=Canavalia gladiata TaxID=3824 RepID=A0AAN9PPY5_CANGL